jgi:hypothetical protein
VIDSSSAVMVINRAVPVAVNVTGEPLSPVDAAVSWLAPIVVPKVQTGDVATPLASVVTTAGEPGAPNEPATAVNVTDTPATELPAESRTITDGAIGSVALIVAV